MEVLGPLFTKIKSTDIKRHQSFLFAPLPGSQSSLGSVGAAGPKSCT